MTDKHRNLSVIGSLEELREIYGSNALHGSDILGNKLVRLQGQELHDVVMPAVV